MKAAIKTALHSILGAALSGGLAALGGKSAAIQLALAVVGSAVSSAISAISQSTLKKPQPAK